MDFKILQSGIDSLVIGYHIQDWLEVGDFEVLTTAKAKAGEKMFHSKGYPVHWMGTDYTMMPFGASGYEFILRNDDVSICIARKASGGKVMPEIRVTFQAPYLWDKGALFAVTTFKRWLESWAVVVGEKVSRCDICRDLAMGFPEVDLRAEVVTMARHKANHIEPVAMVHHIRGSVSSDYVFGAGGDLMGRFYDKVAEVKVHHKEYMLDVFKSRGWDGVVGVTRVEFQLRRDFLKLYQIETFSDMLAAIADIWKYCTAQWLRFCIPGPKTHKTKWTVKDYWQLIQNSYLIYGNENGQLKWKTKQVKYDHLLDMLKGVGSSAAAVIASAGGEPVGIHKLKGDIMLWLESADFLQAVALKVPGFGNMEKPHHHLVDEALRLGAEIVAIN